MKSLPNLEVKKESTNSVLGTTVTPTPLIIRHTKSLPQATVIVTSNNTTITVVKKDPLWKTDFAKNLKSFPKSEARKFKSTDVKTVVSKQPTGIIQEEKILISALQSK